MEEVKKKNPMKVIRWFFLAMSLFLNSFIIVHACLTPNISTAWSNAFVSFFISIFNANSKDTFVPVEVNGLEVMLDTQYTLNDIPGYLDNEIVINKTKRMRYSISPSDATNKAVSIEVSDPSVLKIEQKNNYIYLHALKNGEVTLTVSSLANDSYKKEFNFEVVDKVAPPIYSFIETDLDVYLNESFLLPIETGSIDSSYYDLTLLDYLFDEQYISHDDSYYEAKEVGDTSILVGDKSINIHIADNSSVIYPMFTSINGSEVISAYSSNRYEAAFSNEPTKDEVIWSISDPSIDFKDGVLNLDNVLEERVVTITASSILDKNVFISKDITIKPLEVTGFDLFGPGYGANLSDMPYYSETGQQFNIYIVDNSGATKLTGVNVTSSNPKIAEAYVQSDYIYVNSIKAGKTRITVTSISNPEVSHYVDLEVTVKGIINSDNYNSFADFVRKSIGHFTLFLVSGIFTFLSIYYLLIDNKKLKTLFGVIIPLLIGLLVAIASEVIQSFVPGRFGSFIDVMTDFSGYVIGALLMWLIIYLIKRKKTKIDDSNSFTK